MTKKDRKRKEWILSQAENDKKRKCHSRELFVIPAKAGIHEVFFVILYLIHNPRYITFLLVLKKKKRIWILNQVGDDSSNVIPAKAGIQD
jgi:hypothetical protein